MVIVGNMGISMEYDGYVKASYFPAETFIHSKTRFPRRVQELSSRKYYTFLNAIQYFYHTWLKHKEGCVLFFNFSDLLERKKLISSSKRRKETGCLW